MSSFIVKNWVIRDGNLAFDGLNLFRSFYEYFFASAIDLLLVVGSHIISTFAKVNYKKEKRVKLSGDSYLI